MHSYAQTKIQLFNQLINDGYSKAELVLIHSAYELSVRLFAGRFQSSGKDFIAHGVGTASILGSLRLPAEAVAAGLIHNVYRSGDFGYGQVGVSDAKRKYIEHALGKEVEEYVYRFNTMRWDSHTIPDICDTLEAIGPIERNTILLYLADALEHHLDLEVLYNENAEREGWIGLINQSGHFMIEIAEKLGFPALATDLEKAFKETKLAEIPVELKNKHVRSYSFVIPPRSYGKRLSIKLSEGIEQQVYSLRRRLMPKFNRLRYRLYGLRTVMGWRK